MTDKFDSCRKVSAFVRMLIDISCLILIVWILITFKNDLGYNFNLWMYGSIISPFDRRWIIKMLSVDAILCLMTYFNKYAFCIQFLFSIYSILRISEAVPLEGITWLNEELVLNYIKYAPLIPYAVYIIIFMYRKVKQKKEK